MPTKNSTVDGDALIEQLRLLPEPEALALYSDLTPKLKWLARQRTTGQRRQAIIAHHLIIRSRS